MPVIAQPEFPKVLTKSSWEKAKGVIAVVSGVKTGITEELELVAKKYKASAKSFQMLDIVTLCNQLNSAKGNAAAYGKLKAQYIKSLRPDFLELESAFTGLSSLLARKAVQFQGDPKLIKFSPVLNLMSNEAQKFSQKIDWDTVSASNLEYLQEIIDSREESEKQWAQAAQQVKAFIEDAGKQLKIYKSNPPKLAVYDPFLRGTLRGIGAQIKMAGLTAKFAGPLKTAATLWAQKACPENEDDLPERLKKDIELVKKFKAISDGD